MIQVDWNNLNKNDKELMLKFRNIIDAYDDETINPTQVSDDRRVFVTATHEILKYLKGFEKSHINVISHVLKYQRHVIEDFVIKFNNTNVIKLSRKKKLDSIFNE
jgi:hypothetical protein